MHENVEYGVRYSSLPILRWKHTYKQWILLIQATKPAICLGAEYRFIDNMSK